MFCTLQPHLLSSSVPSSALQAPKHFKPTVRDLSVLVTFTLACRITYAFINRHPTASFDDPDRSIRHHSGVPESKWGRYA